VTFLLDTNICSAHLRRPSWLSHRFTQHLDRQFVPSIVVAEIYTWAYIQDDPTKFLAPIETLLKHDVKVLPYDVSCAHVFGKLKGELRRQGITVSPIDKRVCLPGAGDMADSSATMESECGAWPDTGPVWACYEGSLDGQADAVANRARM